MISLSGCGGTIQTMTQTTAPAGPAPAAVKSGPQLGYIWSDQTRTLRPVLGVPGSSQLGQSVVTANLYVAGAASNVSGLAVLQESDGTLDLMELPDGAATRLSAAQTPGAQIRFAPSGESAIAFTAGQPGVSLLTGLTTTPKVQTVSFPAAIAEAAVSDTGSIAAALTQSGGVVIRTIAANGAANAAGTVAALAGMSFAGTGDDLLIADASANSLTLVRNSASTPSPAAVQSASLLKTPQGVGVSHDGRWAILANTGDTNIVRVDLTAATQPQRFSCACQPAFVAELSGGSVFRVAGADNSPAWMIDASAATPKALFIPASPDAASAQKAGQN